MKVHCHTNLDLVPSEKWPTELPAIPHVGDRIRSAHVWHTNRDQIGFQLELEVVAVCWNPKTVDAVSFGDQADTQWVPEIELHIPRGRNWSIRQFYEWYAPLIGRRVSSFI